MRERILFIMFACLMMAVTPSGIIQPQLDSYQSPASIGGRETCIDAPNVATIEFEQPNPVSMPSHETLLIKAVLKDSTGALINIDPDWGTDKGSIQEIPDLQQARFTPGAFGVTNIWACAGVINETLVVNVLQGTVVTLHLEADSQNVTADDTVSLNLTGVDVRGNVFSVSPPKQNWTIPEGSAISLGSSVVWTPGPTGSQNISVEHAGLEVTIQLNVSHGMAIDLVIEADSVLMTADEMLDLKLVLVDAAGNSWVVEGNWSTQQPEAAVWLTAQGSNAVFDAYQSGSWTILSEHMPSGANESMIAEFEVQVLPGNLSEIQLEGHGATISVDEVLNLDPHPVDAAENLLGSVAMTWTINGLQATNTLTESGFVFSTEVIGHYVIEVEAEGGRGSVVFDVVHGAAVRLVITSEGSSTLIANSGESLEILIEAEDQYANRYVTNAVFEFAEGVGTMNPSGSGTGFYEFTPTGVRGFVMLNVTTEGIAEQIIIDVQAGAAIKLSVEFDGELRVGDQVRVTIHALDESDNMVTTCDAVSTVASSPNGQIIREGGQLYLDLEDPGSASMSVGCLGLQETFYFDVESAILGGMFSDLQTAVMYGSILLMSGITLMLIVLIRRRGGSTHVEEDSAPALAPIVLPVPNPAAAVRPAIASNVSAAAPIPNKMPTPPAIFTANLQARTAMPIAQYPWVGPAMHTAMPGYGMPVLPHGMIPALQLTPAQMGMLPSPTPLAQQLPPNPMLEQPPPNLMGEPMAFTEENEQTADALSAAKDLLSEGVDDSEEEHYEQPSVEEKPEPEPDPESEPPMIEIPELDFEDDAEKSEPEDESEAESESADDDWGADW